MSIDKARAYLEPMGLASRILEMELSSATVELAAKAVGVEGARIAKTLSFQTKQGPILVVAAGDAKVDNVKFKNTFGEKASMLKFDKVEPLIGHAVGGVCPFGINDGVRTYLDESLKRFETVYPACGSGNSAIRLTIAELEASAQNFAGWVNVTKGWEEA